MPCATAQLEHDVGTFSAAFDRRCFKAHRRPRGKDPLRWSSNMTDPVSGRPAKRIRLGVLSHPELKPSEHGRPRANSGTAAAGGLDELPLATWRDPLLEPWEVRRHDALLPEPSAVRADYIDARDVTPGGAPVVSHRLAASAK
ncbi:MAG: hypothetical protein NVS2B6_04200 [Thermoleophilaceae bacterium]